MLLTLEKSNFKLLILVLSFSFFLFNLNSANAEDSLTLSLTPPLFQLTMGPGDFWASSLKVVNINSYDLTLYANVMNFEAEGEEGHGKFIPLEEDINNPDIASHSLASWVEVSKKPIFVPAGATKEIPFSIKVPQNAEPGGHYAAILVGNQPANQIANGTLVNVSSFVSSLLFLRVEGDVVEEGDIRQFSTDKSIYESPKANFTLRFENRGNVHLRPQGVITIYNMWGKERGKLLINQDKSNFGSVLPKSTRKFKFFWEGEGSVFEIGRYTAIANLSFGQDVRKNVSAAVHFWVIPVVPVVSVLGSFFFFITAITWFVRRYIRHVLTLQRQYLGLEEAKEPKPNLKTFTRPFKEGVIDLRNLMSESSPARHSVGQKEGLSDAKREKPMTIGRFLKKYKLFFVFLIVIVLGIIASWIYFREVLMAGRDFVIKIIEIK